MVFQNYALFPHMTVRRNIGFGLAMQRRPKDEIARRVDEALGVVQLGAQADKLPGQLSGGQQQRVAIARAIVVEPPLVLMDEPLSNLDAKLRLEMRAEIRRIHSMLGCSTIYVTHDQDEALSLADRIVVMIDGQTRQIGTPEELYSRPAHPDVAEFMGYRNLLRIDARRHADGGVMVNVAGAQVVGTPRRCGATGRRSWRSGRTIWRPQPTGRSPPRSRWPSIAAATSTPIGACRRSEPSSTSVAGQRVIAPGESLRLHARPNASWSMPRSA